jgi:hypothetical protein
MLPGAAAAQERFGEWEIGVGPTIPFGAAGELLSTGFNIQFGRFFNAEEPVALKIESMASRHDIKDPALLGMNRGHAWLWHVSGNVVLSRPMGTRGRGYAIAGAGVYQRRVTLSHPSTGVLRLCDPWLEICEPDFVSAETIAGTRSSTGAGVNVGAGVALRTGTHYSIFLEARLHHAWGGDGETRPDTPAITDTTSTRFMPLVFGLRF